ncbi:50S ribosomal protein L23 [Candidatus Woesebacteria bacterium RIFCSPHIGHO2_01_FULL_44_10]|uniref:50S ribosomal protein L23 n=1 Tax=Candidatus Woesebacteria bacterium RIFCSPLOWO2_01_FULL_44_14 TaxID=1802525 RepID=A0A1F8C3D8_9BACT|nr:MAG: 50S ribosomal protein L23 [Candidatus Woesebacteria bacterium RIFCSPHIGHO2_01_FULL_44_10]OGM54698.1 MAG: 50S ribosomal protein L23 [Candidatus Woesebacteria bacterium RIFCSPHIGHO2_12_FULL_44_11]OGM70168.1 MAG: 50S ribosomal protein L23 [Candidatus Woesebacteria bacterium RIFCSPLOWO2_01_FULL_44_14]
MKLTPVLTEKSLGETKKGNFTFLTSPMATKYQVKNLVEKTFGVTVTDVRTLNMKKRVTTNAKRKKKIIAAVKKAVVTLKEGDKIKVFEVKS